MERQDDLTKLRLSEEKGLKIQSLKSNEGWQVLEEELTAMLEAIRRTSVSTASLDQIVHATHVGAHNALQSLLDVLRGFEEQGKRANQRIEEIEDERQEDERLAVQTRI